MNDAREELRRKFRPEKARVLFVGESPPAGGTFFYYGNSKLARYTQQAFGEAFAKTFESSQEFLSYFKNLGCYLDDLCLDPINQLEKTQRRKTRKRGVEELTKRIEEADPQFIVVVMKGIAPCVRKAAHRAGFDLNELEVLPFPTLGHQPEYVCELRTLLQDLRGRGIL